jgi:hypothetical protein
MPPNRVTIDEALARAFWMVKLPSMVLLVGPLIAAYFAMQGGWLPDHGLPALEKAAPIFALAFVMGWLAWSLQVPKWRLWAYDRVENIQALKDAAIDDRIIWPDRSIFTRTEIASGAVWARIRELEAQQQFRESDTPATDPKADSEALMNEALPLAEKMLAQHGAFFPYGYVMKPSGEIALVGGYDGADRPKSQIIIDLLVAGFRKDAAAGTVKATALVYDILVVPPGATEKSDAIAVALDHREDYSVVVIFPYVLRGGQPAMGSPFAQKGESRIFTSNAPN